MSERTKRVHLDLPYPLVRSHSTPTSENRTGRRKETLSSETDETESSTPLGVERTRDIHLTERNRPCERTMLLHSPCRGWSTFLSQCERGRSLIDKSMQWGWIVKPSCDLSLRGSTTFLLRCPTVEGGLPSTRTTFHSHLESLYPTRPTSWRALPLLSSQWTDGLFEADERHFIFSITKYRSLI